MNFRWHDASARGSENEDVAWGYPKEVAWVEHGIKPAGDDVTNPTAVAEPDFGCVFTVDPDGDHLLAAPCPP